MERIIILIGGAVIFLGMIFSFFNAVTTNPAAFVIVFLLGVGIIAYFFFQGDGVWNPNNDGYPPFKSILIILGVCLLISWVIGSKPTNLTDCPASVGRWC